MTVERSSKLEEKYYYIERSIEAYGIRRDCTISVDPEILELLIDGAGVDKKKFYIYA